MWNARHLRHLNALIDNKVARYIHWTISKRRGLQVTDKYNEHTPKCQLYHYYVGRTCYHRSINTSQAT
jgi:hypothetical protein